MKLELNRYDGRHEQDTRYRVDCLAGIDKWRDDEGYEMDAFALMAVAAITVPTLNAAQMRFQADDEMIAILRDQSARHNEIHLEAIQKMFEGRGVKITLGELIAKQQDLPPRKPPLDQGPPLRFRGIAIEQID